MEMTKRVFFNRCFLGCLVVGCLALTTSLLAVHVFHLKPCTMCKLQRIPFALLILNASFGLATSYKMSFFRVIQGCFIIGALLGITHFLIQMGALPDPCVSLKGLASAQEFSQMLKTSKCSDVAWSFLGVPISLINFAGCSLVFWLTLKKFRELD
ncbi:MAG: disulfide bond formation protein B [Parachlamydiales bacterium]